MRTFADASGSDDARRVETGLASNGQKYLFSRSERAWSAPQRAVIRRKGTQMELKIPTLAKKIATSLGVKNVANYLLGRKPAQNAQYWSDVNVTDHLRFPSAEASLEYFHWRNTQYHHYLELMPVTGQDGKAVLDYGCGPGNDLAGFAAYSKPSRLVGMDISLRSIAEAKERVALHCNHAEVKPIVESDPRIPLDDASMDYVHSSGVVHHAVDPGKVLREFRRVLRSE